MHEHRLGTCGHHIHGPHTHTLTHSHPSCTWYTHTFILTHLVLVVIMYMVHPYTSHLTHMVPVVNIYMVHRHTHTLTPTHLVLVVVMYMVHRYTSHRCTWYLWSSCTWYTNTLTPTHLVLVVITYMIHPILTPIHLVLVVIMYMVHQHTHTHTPGTCGHYVHGTPTHSHPHTWYLWSSCT